MLRKIDNLREIACILIDGRVIGDDVFFRRFPDGLKGAHGLAKKTLAREDNLVGWGLWELACP